TERVDRRLDDLTRHGDAVLCHPSEIPRSEGLGEGEERFRPLGDGLQGRGGHLVDEDGSLLRLADELALAVLERCVVAGHFTTLSSGGGLQLLHRRSTLCHRPALVLSSESARP